MGIEPTSEAWEAFNKTLKAIDLAALSFPQDALVGNWMETIDGCHIPLGRSVRAVSCFKTGKRCARIPPFALNYAKRTSHGTRLVPMPRRRKHPWQS
jgi:hypothetical protein